MSARERRFQQPGALFLSLVIAATFPLVLVRHAAAVTAESPLLNDSIKVKVEYQPRALYAGTRTRSSTSQWSQSTAALSSVGITIHERNGGVQ